MIAAFNFIPMLAPQNQMTYDTHTFYNTAVAIFVGVLFTVIAFRLIPPLSPAWRTRRLLLLTRRDLRRLTVARKLISVDEWENRIFGRLAVLPPQAELQQSAALAAALAVGSEVIRLRSIADRFAVGGDVALSVRCAGARRQRDGHRSLDRGRPGIGCHPRCAAGRKSAAARARQHLCHHGGACPVRELLRRGGRLMRFVEINLFGVYVGADGVDVGRGLAHTDPAAKGASRFGLSSVTCGTLPCSNLRST